MAKNQRGFGAVETLLILVIVGLIGFGGWYVWHHNKSTAKTTSNTQSTSSASQKTTDAADPYAGWNTYSDTNISLKYPTNWKVEDKSKENGPAEWIKIAGPEDSNIDINKGLPVATHKRLELNISPLSSSTSTNCREDCKIYDTVQLSIPKASGSMLVVSDWDSQGYAQELEVLDDVNAKVGVQTYKLGATINNKPIRIYGTVAYDTNTTSGWIVDVPVFEKTQSFQGLVKILNSITVK